MRIVVFDDYSIGMMTDQGIVDLSDLLPMWCRGSSGAAVEFIARFDELRTQIIPMLHEGPFLSAKDVHFLPPVPRPGQIFAAPLNYQPHVEEMGDSSMNDTDRRRALGSPRTLGLFLKSPGSVCGPDDAIELPPKPGRRFDHEGELAVIIGRTARGVSREEAHRYVFGYSCLMDITMRMTESQREERDMRKSFFSFTPLGPAMVTADEMAFEPALSLRLWVNEQLRQHANTKEMLVGIAELIEITSHVTPLQPGDIITTGTPGGIGPISIGDQVTIEIQGIGRMTLPVTARVW